METKHISVDEFEKFFINILSFCLYEIKLCVGVVRIETSLLFSTWYY